MSSIIDTEADEYLIGQNIRKYRKLKGWTQEKLFDATGIERADISKYENGTKGMPTIPVLKIFSTALEVSIGELTDGVGTKKQKGPANYNQLSPENKAMVDRMINALLLQQRAETI